MLSSTSNYKSNSKFNHWWRLKIDQRRCLIWYSAIYPAGYLAICPISCRIWNSLWNFARIRVLLSMKVVYTGSQISNNFDIRSILILACYRQWRCAFWNWISGCAVRIPDIWYKIYLNRPETKLNTGYLVNL